MPHHHELTIESPIEWVKALFLQPPGPWPEHWAGFPNVCEAFRQLFDEAARAEPPPPPTWQAKRGIVFCGGGWRFFPSIYVGVRLIRELGCNLPIQVWYLGDHGEFDPRMERLLRDYQVGWVNAHAYLRDHHIWHRTIGGWQVKPFAAAYAPFETVIALDADCFPAYDPERFLDHPEFRRVGASFWPDLHPLEQGQYDRFGVPRCEDASFESGQFVVDKSRHWKPLWLACWLNSFSDYVYKHVYGDKDTFLLAWQKAGREFCLPTRRPGWEAVAFLQKDFEGRTLFVHRTRDKFRLAGSIDGQPLPQNYMTEQRGPTNLFIPSLPHEDRAYQLLAECDRLLRPEQHFDLHCAGWCRDIWLEVAAGNEYRLPPRLPEGATVLDLGAHVGAFSWLALQRGAAKVIAVEPWTENYTALAKNLAGPSAGRRVIAFREGVWAQGGELRLSEDPAHAKGNSSTITAIGADGTGRAIAVRGLDEWLELTAEHSPRGRVDVVKIDAEGAEYPALLSARRLDLADLICGEAHQGVLWEGRKWRAEDLFERLRAAGMEVTAEANGPNTLLFWARRSEE